MHKRRVAVLYTHALFGQGIAQLLRADEQLEVTCLRAGLTDTPEQLNRIRPDAIVVEDYGENAALADMVQDLPPTLFIEVHFEDNLMDIYRSRQVMAAQPENLVDAIHNSLGRRGQPAPRKG